MRLPRIRIEWPRREPVGRSGWYARCLSCQGVVRDLPSQGEAEAWAVDHHHEHAAIVNEMREAERELREEGATWIPAGEFPRESRKFHILPPGGESYFVRLPALE